MGKASPKQRITTRKPRSKTSVPQKKKVPGKITYLTQAEIDDLQGLPDTDSNPGENCFCGTVLCEQLVVTRDGGGKHFRSYAVRAELAAKVAELAELKAELAELRTMQSDQQ